jgi:signal transduction histidine kinase
MQRQLRLLSRRLLTAHEDERRMISRDLHDVVAQTLAGINLRLAALRREASIDSADHGRHIAQAQRLVVRSVNRVNRFARELRPAILDDLGLLPALQSLVDAVTERTGLRITLHAPPTLSTLTPLVRTVVYRVIQEALGTSAKHADVSTIDIAITTISGGIRLVVHDDGKAFDVDSTKRPHGSGLDVLGMRERIEMVDGSFSITSTPGVGTTISASIPKIG